MGAVQKDNHIAIAELSTGHFSWTRPDPTRPAETSTRPDPRLPTKSLTQPDPRCGPTLPQNV